METLLIIVGIAIVLLLLFRPAPRRQVIYVPIEVTEERGSGLGCLPLIVIGLLALLVLLAVGGIQI